MAVFRIDKTRDYTVMSNHHLRNKALSLKAKGLLSLMLSLPDNWDYTTKGLAHICKDGVDSICAGVREPPPPRYSRPRALGRLHRNNGRGGGGRKTGPHGKMGGASPMSPAGEARQRLREGEEHPALATVRGTKAQAPPDATHSVVNESDAQLLWAAFWWKLPGA